MTLCNDNMKYTKDRVMCWSHMWVRTLTLHFL